MFSVYISPTLNIGFHDPVHTCIKPQNAYSIILETLYNQINAKALEYNYMSDHKIKLTIMCKTLWSRNVKKHKNTKYLLYLSVMFVNRLRHIHTPC